MPELPEVEHAAACLRRWLVGRRIDRAEADVSRVLRGARPATVARALRGRRLESVERRGKYLLLVLDGAVGAISHLGMTGKWVRRAASDEAPPHSRVRLYQGQSIVHYVDPRMFGRFTVHRGPGLEDLPEVRSIGPDRYQSDGDDDNPFLIYGRRGSACPRCRAELSHMTLGGRTTVFCARCQKTSIR